MDTIYLVLIAAHQYYTNLIWNYRIVHGSWVLVWSVLHWKPSLEYVWAGHYWALQRTHQMSAWAIFRGGADTAAGLSGLVSGPGIIHYPPRCDCMPLSLLWSWLDKVSQYWEFLILEETIFVWILIYHWGK